MTNKLKLIDFCAGVGGMSMTFHEDHRFETVAFIENNKYAASVLNYHYEDIPNYGDATEIEFSELPECDIIIGGTPCQSFSVAGSRKGFEGTSGLFSTFIDAIKEKRPSYFIWENVKGSFSSTNGFDFARVQVEMAEAGYDVRYELLNAKEFGIPQNRERIIAIGCLRDKCSREILFEEGKVGFDSREDGELVGDTNVDLLAWSSSGRSYGREERITKGHAHTLNTGDGCRGQSSCNYVASYNRNEGIKGKRDNAHSLSSSDWRGLNRNQTQNAVVEHLEDIRIRKLVPVECERLMDWPDDYTKYGRIDDKIVEISDSQRYRMCGNGVVRAMMVPVKELILKLDSNQKT